MLQQLLPEAVTSASDADTTEAIGYLRRRLGDAVLILGHHYQRDDIIRWANHRGDSLRLSQIAAASSGVPYIVFCGVHFMAETADILTTPDQAVILPNLSAGCSMADMASIDDVERAWELLGTAIDMSRTIPVTYVNSAASLKAFVGRHGGACCTSTNAAKVLDWAFARGDRVMFFPDQHLGRNTSLALGVDADRMAVWDPAGVFGGLVEDDIATTRVLLWKGHCSVHARFTVHQIERARAEHPGVRVVVHPECSREVVDAADEYGSTEHIIRTVTNGAPGSMWAVGTEVNLVSRLASELPDRTVFCLDPVVCPCSTMYRIHPRYLRWVLSELDDGRTVNRIVVEPQVAADARLALDRMLQLS